MPIARVPGPLATITGPTGIVVASTPWMLNSSVQIASITVSTHGRCSGRQPAITAEMATFSTVTSTRSGGTVATTSSGSARGAVEHPQHALLGRWHDGQAVGPAAREHRLDVVLELGELDAARAQPAALEAHAQLVDAVGVDAERAATGPHDGQVVAEPVEAGDPLPVRA